MLAEAGLTLLGENRAQDLVGRRRRIRGLFTWDFIGHLQSRKVRQVLPLVRYIETVASDSALDELRRHGDACTEVLVEVNVAGEAGKSGIAPADLPGIPGALAGAGGWADDDAAARRRRPRTAAGTSQRCASWPASTGCPNCRWGPARTTSWLSRREPRSCASVRAFTDPPSDSGLVRT